MTTPTHQSLSDVLIRAAQSVDRMTAAHTRPLDITPRQLTTLLTIADAPGSTQAQICEKTGIDKRTVSVMIQSLEADGIVSRRVSRTHKNMRQVFLTNAGRAMIDRLREIQADVNAAIEGVKGGGKIVHALNRIIELEQREQSDGSSAPQAEDH